GEGFEGGEPEGPAGRPPRRQAGGRRKKNSGRLRHADHLRQEHGGGCAVGGRGGKSEEMSILVDKNTRVMTQGITGKTGQFHTRAGRDYANGRNCYVAGVNPRKAGEDFEGIPVYGSVKDAKKATGATVSVIYGPPPFAAAAIDEAVDADLDLVICITEGIPVRDMVMTKHCMAGKRIMMMDPNCPGVITPDEIKI